MSRHDLTRDEFPPIPPATVVHGCGTPYAIIKRNGQSPGKRPNTTLAFITKMKSKDGGRTMIVHGLIRQGNGWTKRPRSIGYSDIVASWRNAPRPATVAAARQRLPRAEAAK